MRKIILPLLCIVLLASCSHTNEPAKKKGSSGKTLELFLVADRNVYYDGSSTKNLMDSIFGQPQPGLPQVEPMFDVRNIPVSSFKNEDMFRMCRNILICNIAASNPNKVYCNENKWAEPQVVFEFAVRDAHAFDSLLRIHYPVIMQKLYRSEYKRIAEAFDDKAGYKVEESIKKQFGFGLSISDEFEIAKFSNPRPDIAWVRKEAKDFGIGVLIQVIPYTDQSIFKEENIVKYTDSLMHHVEGPADSSYMATERRVPFTTKVADFPQSSYAVETRGLWRLFGDFMGGPFVSNMVLSPDNKNVILMVGYVYCPRFGKRDYLMQTEGICHSIKF